MLSFKLNIIFYWESGPHISNTPAVTGYFSHGLLTPIIELVLRWRIALFTLVKFLQDFLSLFIEVYLLMWKSDLSDPLLVPPYLTLFKFSFLTQLY